ncbi:MAG TPA: enoyl-CoA hydratase/isomerase family protein [Bryobacteraceae bacterium]|nr:enoyl-CoA hydratase/isomerase family protein [Bryobacteraceae bacterium]
MSILEAARDGRVLRLGLNRPEKRNALNAELCAALVGALEEADRDSAIGAILITGNGKSFCAGMDLSEIGSSGPQRSAGKKTSGRRSLSGSSLAPETSGMGRTGEHGSPGPIDNRSAGCQPAPQVDEAHEQLFTAGFRLGKPVIAAVNGAALGGGMGLVANCHIVLAAEDATFGLTEIRLGLWPFLIYRAVAAALGDRRTVELALTGRVFCAREAKEIGLVHEISGDVEARAADVAKSVAANSPTAAGSGLRFVRETRGKDQESAGAIARRMRSEVFASEDFQEGIRAFHEKRVPRWPSLEKK